MKNKDQINLIFRALSLALLEIREEAYSIKNPKIYKLSDLIHNLPGAIQQEIKKESPDFGSVLDTFEKRAEGAKMLFWLDNLKNQTNSLEEE